MDINNKPSPTASKDSLNHCCWVCQKYFTLKRNLIKHLKKVHKTIPKMNEVEDRGLRCPLDCKPRFVTRKYAGLRDHITSHHGVNIECEEKTFMTFEEFNTWKHSIERQSICSYIAQTSPKQLSFGQKKTYFVCHRSGMARNAPITGKRKIKIQGSCKLGTHCPSTLDLTEDGEKFSVKFYKTHAGHLLDLIHLKLTREEKTIIADKITKGESYSKIINDAWNEMEAEDTLSRKSILSRKDLHNIKHDSKIDNKDVKQNKFTGTVENVFECSRPLTIKDRIRNKLTLMLELIGNVELDAKTYLRVERSLDNTIKLFAAKNIKIYSTEMEQPSNVSPLYITLTIDTNTQSKDIGNEVENLDEDLNFHAYPYAQYNPVQDLSSEQGESVEEDLLQLNGDAPSSFVLEEEVTGQEVILGGSFDGEDVVATNWNTDLQVDGFLCTSIGETLANPCDPISVPYIESAASAGKEIVLQDDCGNGYVVELSTVNDLHLNIVQSPGKRTKRKKALARIEPMPEINIRAISNDTAGSKMSGLHLNEIQCMRNDRLFLDDTSALFLHQINGTELSGTERAFVVSLDASLEKSNNVSDLHLNEFHTNKWDVTKDNADSSFDLNIAASIGTKETLRLDRGEISASKNVEAVEKPNNLYLNVIKYTGKNKPFLDNASLFPGVQESDVFEDFCDGGYVETHVENREPHSKEFYARKNKLAQDNPITLHKRMRHSDSSISVLSFDDNDGSTVDTFDPVNGIKI